jgi:hypothetical protein
LQDCFRCHAAMIARRLAVVTGGLPGLRYEETASLEWRPV